MSKMETWNLKIQTGILGVMAILIASTGCSHNTPLQPGEEVPSILETPDSTAIRLIWVFQPHDCLECLRFLPDLRRALALNKQIQFIAIQVGDGSSLEDFVVSFFRRQRLKPQVITVEEGVYEDTFRNSPHPRLYLTLGNTIINPDYGIVFDDPIGDALTPNIMGEGAEKHGLTSFTTKK